MSPTTELKRFDPEHGISKYWDDVPPIVMTECSDGEWVRFADVQAYLAGRTAAHGEPISASERKFITKRLRRVAKIVGLESAIPEGDDLIECAGSVLGMIASKLERQAGSAEQVGEREHLLRELKWCIDEGFSGPRTHTALIRAYAALQSAPEHKVMTDAPFAPNDVARMFNAWTPSNVNQQGEQTAQTAEEYLRSRYGAYRGHYEWRALEEAFNAGKATATSTAQKDGGME